MRKLKFFLIISVLLCGCALEPNTQERFDTVLSTLESKEWQTTKVVLENENKAVVLEAKTINLGNTMKTEVLKNDTWQQIDNNSSLAMFCQGDILIYVFQNWNEENKDGLSYISFDAPKEEYSLLEEAFDLSLEKVSGTMILNDKDELEKLVFSLDTGNETYQLYLEMEG